MTETKQADVVEMADRYYWSINQLSKAFGPARETIRNRLYDANVQPSKKRGGYDTYRIREAIEAIYQINQTTDAPVTEPEEMKPKDRLDWYRSENEKMKMAREAGVLIPSGEVAQEFARIVKICVRALEAIPDVLEMKCGLSSESIDLIERECDLIREHLASELAEDGAD